MDDAHPMQPVADRTMQSAGKFLSELRAIRDSVKAESDRLFAGWEPRISRPGFRDSARNLADYIVLRRIDLRRLHMALNLDTAVPTLEEALRHEYSEEERRYVMGQRSRTVIGGPAKCRREIEAMAERYAADEVMLLTITGDYASRLRSYELLADLI